MIVKNIELNNFRSYSNIKVDFSSGINLFHGENGTGKTNILEAIYYLAMLKSFRISDDTVLIKQDAHATKIEAEISNMGLDKNIKLELDTENKRKTLTVNDNKLKRNSEIMGVLPVVLFSPEHIMVIKGDPGLRRNFIDDLLSQINPEYFHILSRYSKEVSHRNYILKQIREGKLDISNLKVWNKQVMEHGTDIIGKRIIAINTLNEILKDKLSDINTHVSLDYTLKHFKSNKPEDIAKDYVKYFEDNQSEEIARSTTLIGPHRDDIAISYNGLSAKRFGSEGQQRITTILIKLAEGLMINEKLGTYPVILLDDFSSELDNPNRSFIAGTFSKFEQIIVTTTYPDNLKGFKPSKLFHVEHNAIKVD